MKLREIVESRGALDELLGLDLPFDNAWDLKIFLSKIQPMLKIYDEEKIKLIKKFGKEIVRTDEDGKEIPTGNWEVKPENIEDYSKEMTPLWDKEVKNKLPKIKHTDLKKVNESIKTSLLLELDWLIV